MADKTQKWIAQAVRGSDRAFNRLIKAFSPMVFSIAVDLTANVEDARDISQETFFRAYRNIGSFKGTSRFSTWLYRIAYNCSIDFIRKNRGRYVPIDEKTLTASHPGRENQHTAHSRKLEKALGNLSEKQKTAVVLFYYHGLPLTEIGEILSCSHSTARVHLFRGLKNLKKYFGKYMEG